MCEEFDTIIDNATQTLNDAHGTLTHFHLFCERGRCPSGQRGIEPSIWLPLRA